MISAHANIHFEYFFHPVGQGLFASGLLKEEGTHTPAFEWVYDCGTSSSPRLVDSAINTLSMLPREQKHLNIVAISHFDHDHVSGLCDLVSRFTVDTLLLPYMSLEHRLRQAFDMGIDPTDRVIGFAINPVEYLSSIDNASIEHVLFVQPNSRQGSSIPPQDNDTDDSVGISYGTDAPPEDTWTNISEEHHGPKSVEFLSKDGAIRIGQIWEFVPYNAPIEHDNSESFRNAVNDARERLLSGPDRERALKELKAIYDEEFGDTSDERNIISLFLYAGPIYRVWPNLVLWPCCTYEHRLSRSLCCGDKCYAFVDNSEKCSILYSGDGYLDKCDRIKHLAQYLQEERMDRIGVFQVMHHGARNNWCEGVASAISPEYSVFSSDPERKDWGHPHAEVLRDFWRHCPVQVDKIQGVRFCGIMAHK